MVRLSHQRGVPVIVVDEQVVVGFDRPRLEKLLSRAVQAPAVGLAVATAATYAGKHGLQLPDGAYVGRVKPGSPAAGAGMLAGDVITSVAGRPVRGEADLRSLLASLRGQRVTATVWRNGETKRVQLDL